jgi:hypothetical protein
MEAVTCNIFIYSNRNILIFHFHFINHRVAGNEIINPAQSARMVTSDSFSFTYGTIEVRAKMPKGDWIWPGRNELLLNIKTKLGN